MQTRRSGWNWKCIPKQQTSVSRLSLISSPIHDSIAVELSSKCRLGKKKKIPSTWTASALQNRYPWKRAKHSPTYSTSFSARASCFSISRAFLFTAKVETGAWRRLTTRGMPGVRAREFFFFVKSSCRYSRQCIPMRLRPCCGVTGDEIANSRGVRWRLWNCLRFKHALV